MTRCLRESSCSKKLPTAKECFELQRCSCEPPAVRAASAVRLVLCVQQQRQVCIMGHSCGTNFELVWGFNWECHVFCLRAGSQTSPARAYLRWLHGCCTNATVVTTRIRRVFSSDPKCSTTRSLFYAFLGPTTVLYGSTCLLQHYLLNPSVSGATESSACETSAWF